MGPSGPVWPLELVVPGPNSHWWVKITASTRKGRAAGGAMQVGAQIEGDGRVGAGDCRENGEAEGW